jgi:hypothetical protein
LDVSEINQAPFKRREETMSEESKQAAILQVLCERFETQRLPRALALKEKVDAGQVLEDTDIDFLEQVFRDAQENRHLVEQHPEWQDLVAQALSLYEEITAKALANQKAAGKAP